MIGNDIVDLKHMSKHVDWKRSRFLDKVFTQQEQSIIFSSEDQHKVLWLFWSMKEAAYKVYVQEFGERFFNPKVFQCKLTSPTTGSVFFKDLVYFTESELEQNYVYSTATKDKAQEISSSVFKIRNASYNFQSSFVKEQLLNHISKANTVNRNNLTIVKNASGVPRIIKDSEKLSVSLSLTHCGNYCGFSILNA